MARLAGDGSHYDLSKVLWQLRQDIDYNIALPSVTTILNALPKNLTWWAAKLGVKGALDLVRNGFDIEGDDLDELTERAYEEYKKAKVHTPNAVRDKAGDRGSAAHDALERFVKGEAVSDEDTQNPYFQAGLKWLKEKGPNKADVVAAEIPLFSLEHRFAGTCDLLYKKDGQYCVADWKTSKSIYESHLVQVSAYAAAAVEMGIAEAPVKAVVVCIKPNGTYTEKVSPCSLEDFLAVKRVYDFLQSFKGAA